MCGILGTVHLKHGRKLVDGNIHALRSRGPDESNVVQIGDAVFGHTRLAVIDLSSAGRQPMMDHHARVLLAFNGEIYNYVELRNELSRTRTFRSTGDTEVILNGYLAWGISALARRLRGMFAFAIWDNRSKEIFLVRDHLGKKPLYYSSNQEHGDLVFATTPNVVKNLLPSPAELDQAAISEFWLHRYVPGEQTCWARVKRVQPGRILRWKAGVITEEPFWSPARCNVRRTRARMLESTCELIDQAVRRRLQADVPIGAFLSGGVDSSAVVGFAMKHVHGLKTFSISFPEYELNEGEKAKAVAKYLETEHYEVPFSEQALGLLPKLIHNIGQPFADPAAVATLELARHARKHVTVVLTGDGGDEVFGGYLAPQQGIIARYFRRCPFVPRAISSGLRAVGMKRLANASRGVHILAETGVYSLPRLDSRLHWPQLKFAGRSRNETTLCQSEDWAAQILLHDLAHLLPDQMLCKTDGATMAESLEARCPFLDVDLVEHVLSLDRTEIFRLGRPKELLKRICKPMLPDWVTTQKKQGFALPVDMWFRGQLGKLLGSLVDQQEDLFINPREVRAFLQHHNSGKVNGGAALWATLCYVIWHRMNVVGDCKENTNMWELQ